MKKIFYIFVLLLVCVSAFPQTRKFDRYGSNYKEPKIEYLSTTNSPMSITAIRNGENEIIEYRFDFPNGAILRSAVVSLERQRGMVYSGTCFFSDGDSVKCSVTTGFYKRFSLYEFIENDECNTYPNLNDDNLYEIPVEDFKEIEFLYIRKKVFTLFSIVPIIDKKS